MPIKRGTQEPNSSEGAHKAQVAEADAPPMLPVPAFPFSTLYEVNERCIELLVNAARSEERLPFALVAPLRELLISLGTAPRRRAAQIGLLLVDLEFDNPLWWRAICSHPDRQWRTGKWRGQFPRRTAIPLARDTLMLVWQCVQADLDVACALLGLARPVAERIATLKLSEINRIAARRARHIYPRWFDQPLVWRTLLQAAAGNRPIAFRNFQIQGLQLMGGALLSAMTETSAQPLMTLHADEP